MERHRLSLCTSEVPQCLIVSNQTSVPDCLLINCWLRLQFVPTPIKLWSTSVPTVRKMIEIGGMSQYHNVRMKTNEISSLHLFHSIQPIHFQSALTTQLTCLDVLVSTLRSHFELWPVFCAPCCRYQSSPSRSTLPCPRHDSMLSVTNKQT